MTVVDACIPHGIESEDDSATLYHHVINQEEQALASGFIRSQQNQQLIAIENLHGINTKSSCHLMKFAAAAGKRQELPAISSYNNHNWHPRLAHLSGPARNTPKSTVLNFLEGVSSTRQCTEANAVLLAPTKDVDVSCIALHEAAAASKTKLDDQRMQLTHVNHHEDEECCELLMIYTNVFLCEYRGLKDDGARHKESFQCQQGIRIPSDHLPMRRNNCTQLWRILYIHEALARIRNTAECQH
ncbi:RNA directed DNA polymerase [Echinococcus multilocularis]|uniref:RNA directed DNA polymerase n=1 Tax=Echinococcus multilocularis TaxID=6211 RepID=A0A0S4MMH7_ECHMU|nr:RNA directed DNA polymerase [Echinococcus multilocularis]